MLSESCDQTGIAPGLLRARFFRFGQNFGWGAGRRDVAITITASAMITTVAIRICGVRRNLDGCRPSGTDLAIHSGGQLADSRFGREDGGVLLELCIRTICAELELTEEFA